MIVRNEDVRFSSAFLTQGVSFLLLQSQPNDINNGQVFKDELEGIGL